MTRNSTNFFASRNVAITQIKALKLTNPLQLIFKTAANLVKASQQIRIGIPVTTTICLEQSPHK